ncbi:hypothetical protein [Mycobacterium intracellulare]|uniref:hypothetical protein n=1 Tax=Mycobacterium intracellulare TaxID=1767 RepID=UPI00191670E5|nr:hypothetical protein [Mycobacterium intracellulare]MCA2355761.1 hypothetical protein [Mycobacterium intracellulare]MCA2365991.1 hypothetical protein [Mycobacterium intracellulare]
MQPDPRCTVIMTQTVRASGLADYQRRHWPLFIDDNEPQYGLDGTPSHFFRKIKSVSDYFGYLGNRNQLTVEFEDGTPGRTFDPDDEVVVHFIIRGTDITTAG